MKELETRAPTWVVTYRRYDVTTPRDVMTSVHMTLWRRPTSRRLAARAHFVTWAVEKCSWRTLMSRVMPCARLQRAAQQISPWLVSQSVRALSSCVRIFPGRSSFLRYAEMFDRGTGQTSQSRMFLVKKKEYWWLLPFSAAPYCTPNAVFFIYINISLHV